MASYFNLLLDTIAPDSVTLSINNNASHTNSTVVTLKIDTLDSLTTGYTMKIWGTDTAANEAAALWESYAKSKSVSLPSGDGLKTVYVKVRDAVYNESTTTSAQITLDTVVPVVTITGPDVSTISKVEGKDKATFSFMSNDAFTEYTVRVVPTTASLHTSGVQIPTAGGSTNTSGISETGYPSDTAINCDINGNDLAVASAGDGTKIIKIFVKDKAGNWSVV